jgi:ATP-binding cassette, subfamily B, bacterial
MQRIGDHRRIETFLTGTTLNILFSLVNLVIFGLVLLYYHLLIFCCFSCREHPLWPVGIYVSSQARAELDHKRFAQMSAHQSNLIQLSRECRRSNSRIANSRKGGNGRPSRPGYSKSGSRDLHSGSISSQAQSCLMK